MYMRDEFRVFIGIGIETIWRPKCELLGSRAAEMQAVRRTIFREIFNSESLLVSLRLGYQNSGVLRADSAWWIGLLETVFRLVSFCYYLTISSSRTLTCTAIVL